MLKLEKITDKNVWRIIELEVEEAQKSFVATNTQSMIEAYTTLASGGVALPFGIYDDETPVGFVMIGYGGDSADEPEYARNAYSIWRLMIDRRYQRRGYGRQAMKLALDYIRTQPAGYADRCYLSYEPENVNAKALYNSFGFIETGDMDDDELVAVMKL